MRAPLYYLRFVFVLPVLVACTPTGTTSTAGPSYAPAGLKDEQDANAFRLSLDALDQDPLFVGRSDGRKVWRVAEFGTGETEFDEITGRDYRVRRSLVLTVNPDGSATAIYTRPRPPSDAFEERIQKSSIWHDVCTDGSADTVYAPVREKIDCSKPVPRINGPLYRYTGVVPQRDVARFAAAFAAAPVCGPHNPLGDNIIDGRDTLFEFLDANRYCAETKISPTTGPFAQIVEENYRIVEMITK